MTFALPTSMITLPRTDTSLRSSTFSLSTNASNQHSNIHRCSNGWFLPSDTWRETMSDRSPRMFNIDRHSMSILSDISSVEISLFGHVSNKRGKMWQFLLDPTKKVQLPAVRGSSSVQDFFSLLVHIHFDQSSIGESVGTNDDHTDETAPTTMFLAKSTLKAEQQISQPPDEKFSTSFFSLSLSRSRWDEMIFEHFLSHFHVGYSATVKDTTTHLISDSFDENTPLVGPLTLKVIQAQRLVICRSSVSNGWSPRSIIRWSFCHRSLKSFSVIRLTVITAVSFVQAFLAHRDFSKASPFVSSNVQKNMDVQLFSRWSSCIETIIWSLWWNDQRWISSTSSFIVLCHQMKRRDPKSTDDDKSQWLFASIAQ